MPEELSRIKTELYNYVVAAVKEGLDVISQLRLNNEHIGTYYNWPKMSFHDSGLPSFSEEFFTQGPIKYQDAFNSYKGDLPESFLNLWEFAKNKIPLKKRLLHPNMLLERDDDQEFNVHTEDFFKFIVIITTAIKHMNIG